MSFANNDLPPGASSEKPWGNVQHFDVWSFQKADGESSYFGKLPPERDLASEYGVAVTVTAGRFLLASQQV